MAADLAVKLPDPPPKLQLPAKTEANFLLSRLASDVAAYHMADHYADGKLLPRAFPPSVGWTPPRPCCKEPTGRCLPKPDSWSTGAWRDLKFRPAAAHIYQYRLISAGIRDKATATIEARADRDCDGVFELRRVAGTVSGSGSVSWEFAPVERAGE